jgi:hypothetical protein
MTNVPKRHSHLNAGPIGQNKTGDRRVRVGVRVRLKKPAELQRSVWPSPSGPMTLSPTLHRTLDLTLTWLRLNHLHSRHCEWLKVCPQASCGIRRALPRCSRCLRHVDGNDQPRARHETPDRHPRGGPGKPFYVARRPAPPRYPPGYERRALRGRFRLPGRRRHAHPCSDMPVKSRGYQRSRV